LGMDLETKLPVSRRIRLFLGRFRRLPVTLWVVLATIFGIADFLTWSVLANVGPHERIRWTMGIAAIALLVTVITMLWHPTEDEKMANARVFERAAREAWNATNYAKAEKLLRRAVELDSERVGAWALLGRTLIRLGEYNEAIPALTRALKLTQINPASKLHNRGVAYAMLGQYGRALDDFEESLKERPDQPDTLRWRSLVWLYLGSFANALQDVDSALEMKPLYLCGHATKAVVLHLLGQAEAAEDELAHCSSLHPQDADDFYCLALAYSQLKDAAQALQALPIAIERDPKYRARAAIDPLFDQLRTDPRFQNLVSSDRPPGSKN